MHITEISSAKIYCRFIKKIYKQMPFFKDNKTALIKMLCNKNGVFYKNTKQKMLAVTENNETLCQAVFIRHKNYADVLMVSFFEALADNLPAVKMLMRHAAEYAARLGCKKIEVSLDGHCNNNLGFLADNFDSYPAFGSSYNPPYYNDYFKRLHFNEIELVSFWDYLQNVPKIDNFPRKDDITLEYADFSPQNFTKTMKRFTDLNNTVFASHPYYFIRSYEEDAELFKSFSLLLKSHNLIFAVQNGKDIGFMLWYKDFNAFVPPGKAAGVTTFIKSRLLGLKTPQIKIAEIGILTQAEGTTAILKLFREGLGVLSREKYSPSTKLISSWILNSNVKSKRISKYFLKKKYKKMLVYEKNI